LKFRECRAGDSSKAQSNISGDFAYFITYSPGITGALSRGPNLVETIYILNHLMHYICCQDPFSPRTDPNLTLHNWRRMETAAAVSQKNLFPGQSRRERTPPESNAGRSCGSWGKHGTKNRLERSLLPQRTNRDCCCN
jgi:hypothetical protein